MLFKPYVRFHSLSFIRVTEWPPNWEIAAHLAVLPSRFSERRVFLSDCSFS